MPTMIHIIDPSKPSLVMTSEVFKDKIPGAIVSYSSSAKDAMAYLAEKGDKSAPDLVVVDFDLPDADGVSLVRELRKTFKGPIFLTAFANDVVKRAVAEELFHYNDSCQWISKPIRHDNLDKKIEQFLFNRYRLGRRFEVDFTTLAVGKGAGRGKRAPKFDGKTTNLSLGGAGLELLAPAKLKIGEELIVAMAVPSGVLEGSGPLDNLKPVLAAAKAAEAKQAQAAAKSVKSVPVKASVAAKEKSKKTLKGASATPAVSMMEKAAVKAASAKAPPIKYEEYKIKATVAWLGGGGRKVGLSFARMSDQQRRQIETFLKGLSA